MVGYFLASHLNNVAPARIVSPDVAVVITVATVILVVSL